MKTINFEVEGKKYQVGPLTYQERQEIQKKYNEVYQEALQDPNSWFANESVERAKKANKWDDEKEAELKLIQKQIIDLEDKLEAGGYELEDAKKDAEQISRLRSKIIQMQVPLLWFQRNSIEGQARSIESEYSLYLRIKDNKGKRYCKNFDEYLNKRDGEDIVVSMAFIQYALADTPLDDLPENKFLDEYFPVEKAPAPEKEEKKPFLKDGKPVEKA